MLNLSQSYGTGCADPDSTALHCTPQAYHGGPDPEFPNAEIDNILLALPHLPKDCCKC